MKTMFIALLLSLSLPSMGAAGTATVPDAQTIIERSVEANQRDWRAAPHFDYTEQDRAADGSTRTYREMMILGSRYERLLAVDGEPIPTEQQAEEVRKLEKAIAERSAESPDQRAERIAEYERGRKRDDVLMEQLAVAFQFKLIGEQILNGHRVYVLKATPRPDYQPPNMQAEVLTGMQGKLWIDEATFQWVRVQAQVIHPVSIEGFLARVEPGTRFLLEKAPVTEGIWLPSRFTMQSTARVLFFFSRHTQADETYSDYRPSSKEEALRLLMPQSHP
jgi:hypothetical protein